MHQAARAAKEGRLSIMTREYRNAILDQSSRIPKTFTDKGRIRVPPKHGVEWEGMGSPDLWDAVCFAFLEGLTYVVSTNREGSARSLGDSAIDMAEGMFCDV